MQIIMKYGIVTLLLLLVVPGIFNNLISYSQKSNEPNSTEKYTAMANLSKMDFSEDKYSSNQKEYNKTSIVRDSVTILLQNTIIPGTDFIHLYDSTPYHILNGHVALKAPCRADATASIQVLIGSAPNMTATALENIPTLSTPGEQCLYHADLIPGGNVTTITDITLSNPTEDEIEFPPTSTVIIGINEITKGEHDHSESEEHATMEAEDKYTE
ncbi:MAG: hypothetical protein ACR2F1_14310 [Nitrososphaeraceae archaeon]